MLLFVEQRLLLRGEEVADATLEETFQRRGELIHLTHVLAPVFDLGDAVVLNLHDPIPQLLHANLEQEALNVIDRVFVDYVAIGVLVFDELVDVAPPNVSMTF
jgi:hypothetical protein